MLKWFRKNDSGRSGSKLRMVDLDGNVLNEGDMVESLRYNLGKCKLLKTDNGYEYESVSTGEKVSWARMVDAATDNQKVRKIE
jgi:hypothetical protein